MTRAPAFRGVLGLALLLTACGTASEPEAAHSPSGAGSSREGLAGELSVFAAASLADAFEDIADAFEAAHPDVRVRANVAGSHTLARQIHEGASADVFASSSVEQMAVVEQAGNVADAPEVFAVNRLAIAVELGNPRDIGGLAGLAHPDLIVVLPAPEVPAGAYARQALDAAGVALTPASLAYDVRAALATVMLGEADAALVYASDVVAADGRVEGVDIAPEDNVTATYPIAPLAGAANPEAAQAFVAFVHGPQAQAILADHGFTSP